MELHVYFRLLYFFDKVQVYLLLCRIWLTLLFNLFWICRSSLSLQHCSISGDRWDDQSHIFASDDSWPEVAFANSFFDRKRGRKWRGALATMAGCMRYREWACCSTAKDHKTASDCRSNDWRVAEPLQKISVSWFLFKSFGWFLWKAFLWKIGS